ncbi:MAG: tyrosine recombinase XerC [Oscillospiraceae bacterium]
MSYKNKSMPFYLKEFLTYLKVVKNRSERTVEAYYVDLSNFLKFIKIHKGLVADDFDYSTLDISDISIDTVKSIALTDVYEYLDYAATDRSNTAKTRARKVSAIRMFFKYLTKNTQYLETNPVEAIETPTIKNPLPKHLTLDKTIELLNSVNGKYSKRDYCILTFFVNCGFRLSELVNINISDISDNHVRITGKGNKQRVLYLNDACQRALNDYLQDENRPKQKGGDALFVSRQGQRISTRRVQQIVENALKQCGLSGEGYSTHKLRHTAATLMYQHGHVDVRVLQKILGHEGLQTTQIYTHVADEQIEQALNDSPLADIKPKNENKK